MSPVLVIITPAIALIPPASVIIAYAVAFMSCTIVILAYVEKVPDRVNLPQSLAQNCILWLANVNGL